MPPMHCCTFYHSREDQLINFITDEKICGAGYGLQIPCIFKVFIKLAEVTDINISRAVQKLELYNIMLLNTKLLSCLEGVC